MEVSDAALKVPDTVYYVAGLIILTNIGVVVSVAFAAMKAVWWFAKLDSRVSESRAMAIRAHKRIDILENK